MSRRIALVRFPAKWVLKWLEENVVGMPDERGELVALTWDPIQEAVTVAFANDTLPEIPEGHQPPYMPVAHREWL